MTRYLEKNHQSAMVDMLTAILADTFVLYFKTHAYHWNVEGVHFRQFHEMFEEQYTELWQATDVIAERIRALGAYAPCSFEALKKHASLVSAKSEKTEAMKMVADLAVDHETLSAAIADGIENASEVGDEVTADILISRQTAHDQAAWMLKSTGK